VREYLKTLSGPTTWLDFVDLVSKTVVAAGAAAISVGVWLYKDQQDKADQVAAAHAEQQKTDFDRRLRLLTLATSESADKRQSIELFLNVLPKSAEDPDWRIKTQSLSAYCTEQTKDLGKDKRPPLLTMLCDANAKKTAEFAANDTAKPTPAQTSAGTSYLRSPIATAQVSKLAAIEAAGAAAPSKNWYAVVASVPINQPQVASALARSLNKQLAAATSTCDVYVFKTKISNSFAITSGPAKSEEDARRRVDVIRASGLVPDAFAQPDKGWTSAEIPQPTRSRTPPCAE